MVQRTIQKDNPADVVALLRRLPAAFPDALVELMEWRECTVEALAEGTMVSYKTIQRLRTGQLRPTMRQAVALCVGLQLPFAFALELIKKAEPCSYNNEYLAYLDLLPKMYDRGLDMFQFNDALVSHGIKAIGQND